MLTILNLNFLNKEHFKEINSYYKSEACLSALVKTLSSAPYLSLGRPFVKFTVVYHHLPYPSVFLQGHASELNREMLETIILISFKSLIFCNSIWGLLKILLTI